MQYILAFLLLAVPQDFFHLSLKSEGKYVNIYLPLSLVGYTDMFMEGEEGMGETLKEVELHIGDTLIDIDTEEEKVLMVVVGKNEVLEKGEKVPKWFHLKIEDKKEGKISIKIPLWAFNVLSKFGVDTMGEADASFFNALTESIEEMGGGRYRFLEVRDKESSIDIYIE
jgi:hypothetical protein